MLKIKVSEKDILAAMQAELNLAQRDLKIPGENPPYFVSYLLTQKSHFEVWGRYGAPYGHKKSQGLNCYAEIRVGDYALDQNMEGGLQNFHSEESDFWCDNHPLDGNQDVLRFSLRKLTEDKYREALEGFYKKKSFLVGGGTYSHKIPNFYPEKKRIFREDNKEFNPDSQYWYDLVVPLSGRFRKYTSIQSSYVELRGDRIRSYYLNTEGSQIITDQVFFTIELVAISKDHKGRMIRRQKNFHFLSENEPPSNDMLAEGLEDLARDVEELSKAPVIEPHNGPVLLGPQASGLFFHEVLGHRLEGERLLSQEEGQTLKKKKGKKIVPEFISVYDDPSQSEFQGTPLLGHYLYDSEGIPSQRVDLIRDGVLKGFLLSRTPINKSSRSNGHGRTEDFFPPMARMGNLFVEIEQSVSREELEDQLLQTVKKLKKPFGLIIDEVAAGETETSSYDFQVIKGEPEKIYLLDAKTGKKTLVRGLDFIGTPLSSVNDIISGADDYDVFNSWCTAESGDVRVASIAPSLLLADLELQRSSQKTSPRPILRSYWQDFEAKKKV